MLTREDLRFAVVALQFGIVDREEFLDALDASRRDARPSLMEDLIASGRLDEEARHQIERELQRRDSTVPELVDASPGSTSPDAERGELKGDVSSRLKRKHLHAEGALGRVWIVHDDTLGRQVALKELKPRYAADPDAQRYFLREAQVAGQLEHPNIVPVYEVGIQENGDLYYAMRLIDGRTLAQAIDEQHQRVASDAARALDLQALLEAFVSVCQAIAFAHSRGVIHRDLKPDNIILGEFGEVIVLDWGTAKQIATNTPSPETTSDGDSIVGTPAYMSPEQALGDDRQTDQRTDIYGLGAILFHILTGEPPHRQEIGESQTVALANIVRQPTPRARSRNHRVRRALDAVCSHAMAAKPSDRYSSAVDLARDIRCFLAGVPVSVYREPPIQRLARWAVRHTFLTQAMALLATLLIAVGMSIVVQSWQGSNSAGRLELMNLKSEAEELAFSINSKLKRLPSLVVLCGQLKSVSRLIDTKLEGETKKFEEARRQLAFDFAATIEGNPDIYQMMLIDAQTGRQFLSVSRAYNEQHAESSQNHLIISPPARLRVEEGRRFFDEPMSAESGTVFMEEVMLAGPGIAEGHDDVVGIGASQAIVSEKTGEKEAVLAILIDFDLAFPGVVTADPARAIYIVDRDGYVLFEPDPGPVTSLSEGTREKVQTVYPSLDPLFTGNSSEVAILGSTHGDQIIYGQRVVWDEDRPDEYLAVIATYSWDALLSSTERSRLIVMVLTPLLAMLAIGGSYLFSRILTRTASGQLGR
ncbi:Serine/threonine-protein kinase PknD [Planctomycetes bacterium Pan216]|uniref:Serine/threonine-protein kinase PknD n=1 Tax=Kolteria novifilia TaxID=2527975 RepID=A0A518B1J2_9BACT|nr:Serine/threonine-protein kinase PknD [Planctomycetes bacterium Pan216]